LSEGQKGFFFMQLSEPSMISSNIPLGFELSGELDGKLDGESVYQVIEHLLETHPVLRTTFTVDAAGEWMQQVRAVSGYLQRDIRDLEKGETLREAFQTLEVVPFDLSKEVFRLHIRIDTHMQKTALLFVFHHIVVDGTSIMLLLSKLIKLLTQQLLGAGLMPLPADRSYFDFIRWEQHYLSSKEASEDLTYWKNKLQANAEPLVLPYDHIALAPKWESVTRFELVKWNGEELERLKTTAKALRVNTSVLFLSAYKVLLYHLTGADKIVVKNVTAGRHKEQYDESIGLYVNMMLSFDRILPAESFAALVDRVRSGFTSDIDHSSYPYSKVLAEFGLTVKDGEDRFPAMFLYHNIFDNIISERVMEKLTPLETSHDFMTNAYGFFVSDLRHEILLKLKYREDRFLRETINRHLGYFKKILATVVSDPKTSIQALGPKT
jgi:hypothetical protein